MDVEEQRLDKPTLQDQVIYKRVIKKVGASVRQLNTFQILKTSGVAFFVFNAGIFDEEILQNHQCLSG